MVHCFGILPILMEYTSLDEDTGSRWGSESAVLWVMAAINLVLVVHMVNLKAAPGAWSSGGRVKIVDGLTHNCMALLDGGALMVYVKDVRKKLQVQRTLFRKAGCSTLPSKENAAPIIPFRQLIEARYHFKRLATPRLSSHGSS